MNLFRSEEHIERWLAGRKRGGTATMAQLREASYGWFGDRLSAEWRPRTREESQAILAGAGLTGEFWRLP